MLSLLHNPHLVNLLGYCADGDQRLLVYEFMPLGSLEDHLHGNACILVIFCFSIISCPLQKNIFVMKSSISIEFLIHASVRIQSGTEFLTIQ